MKQVVVLCGFMGCGKTTVGRALSRFTGFAYRDLDEWIEMRAGKTVANIFNEDGEAHFSGIGAGSGPGLRRGICLDCGSGRRSPDL